MTHINIDKRFVVLDGSSLLYRAFYALPDLINSKGVHTNAIHGFASMLSRIISDFKPRYMAVAFDKGHHTFRNNIFAEYKGTRDKTPEELIEQIPIMKELVETYQIPFLEVDNYEADDIIGTLASQAAEQGYDTIIVTGDRDELQLIKTNIKVAITKKGISEHKLYDEEAFIEEYEIHPINIIDLKGLMGDSSDNIPGIPKVGIKTATRLLKEYGSLENVLANAAKISGKKLQESISIYSDQAILSKKLATIELNVPNIEFIPNNFILAPNRARMKAFCVRYELNSAWRTFVKLFGDDVIASNKVLHDTNEIEQSLFAHEDMEQVIPIIEKSNITSMSLESNDIDIEDELKEANVIGLAGNFVGKLPNIELRVLAVAIAKNKQHIRIVILDKNNPRWENNVQIIRELLADDKSDKIISLADLKNYFHADIVASSSSNLFDIDIADYLLQPENSRRDYSRLKSNYLDDIDEIEFSDEYEKLAYEAELAIRLYEPMNEQLKSKSLLKLYNDIELPLVEVLANMERTGVYVNKDKLEKALVDMNERIEEIQRDIYALVGEEFNINSPKQMGEILFNKLGLVGTKKTKSGYSTDAEVLEGLKNKHPVIIRILEYRQLAKLISTYLEGIGELIVPTTGRVYTNFNQTVTATGRLSSSEPNLQNIPVRTSEGRAIRALFEPSNGYDMIVSADYSQIELRLLAHMSGDKTFIDAFNKNQDIHRRTASEVFSIPLDKVSDKQRHRAKAVNFGIVYGISDYGLAKDLSIPRKEAAYYIENYFERYSGVKNFLDETIEKARKDGFVTTMFNRRRDLLAINTRNYNQRTLTERMAMNTPIQGSAADIIKLAMIATYQALQAEKLKSRLLLQVHDELVLEVVRSELEQVTAILKHTMEGVVKLDIPLVIEVHSGANWAETK